MVFNIQKFLVKNKLTKRSRLNEDAETKTDAEKVAMGAEEGDDEMFDPDSEIATDAESNSDYKVNAGYSVPPEPKPIRTPKGKTPGFAQSGMPGYEIDPEAGRTPSNKPVRDLQSKQTKLKALEDKKDALLLQLKSSQLSLDKYKAAIGNIPNQIKKLRFDIERQLDPVIGDSDEDDI